LNTRRVGVIMNGITGRMGQNQHLVRSILAIRAQGGVRVGEDEVIVPDPILLGRNERRVRAVAEALGVERWSTDLERCLANPEDEIYFDAQKTLQRSDALRKAIAAGKHVYCEKPTAANLETALELARLARAAGIRHGVVQDKLFLPGMIKLKRLVDGGFFGRILSVRGDFGYWVQEGDWQLPQRPSWNFRRKDGGGIIVDMFSHWRYVLDQIVAPVKAVSCLGFTHIPERVDEDGKAYKVTAEDAAYGTFLLEGDIVAQMNSSWCTRVYRDDLFVLQIDGTEGSAMAGLRRCYSQHRVNSPRPLWNPDLEARTDYRADWTEVPDNGTFDNGFKVQWELFLKHVVCGDPFPWDLMEGAKCVQLAELGEQSWLERRWVDIPDLEA
jgi:predicted dehydrogenase